MTEPEHQVAVQLDADPWLPVQNLDGSIDRVSFRALFTDAHNVARLILTSPAGYASLNRILAAIAYRVSGLTPTTTATIWYDERTALYERGHFDSALVNEYFDRYRDRFDLFDAHRPWMQDPRLRTECKTETGINKIIVGRPSGNNATFLSPFHHENQSPVDVASAVENLLINQFYGASGRCTTRTHEALPAEAGFTAIGPLRSRLSYHPQGANLFQTLVASLIAPQQFAAHGNPGSDLADWELPALYDPKLPRPVPAGIISYLANNSGHALLLHGQTSSETHDVEVTTGWYTWKYHKLVKPGPSLLQDPFLAYRRNKDGSVMARQAKLGRDLWRDLPALLSPTTEPDGFQQPQVISALREFPEEVRGPLRVAAYGFVQHGFQPTNDDWNASLSPAVLHALQLGQRHQSPTDGDEWRTAIAEWVRLSEQEAVVLNKALTGALQQAYKLDPQKDDRFAWANKVRAEYWRRAHTLFTDAVESSATGAIFGGTTSGPQGADALLRKSVIDLYDVGTQTARDGRALASVARHRPYPWRPAPIAASAPNISMTLKS